ncbi:hypothetical protein [Asaia sp. As-1742]|uniref:hypothetical protein n=1 Tax=Asaia sp. As-1742 TaxID=2608325 RepID=UPI001421C5D4|nr:hypothetical protein [Asaia sp. As-1742]
MIRRDLIHSTYSDLYSISEILAAFMGASEPPPLEMLAAWAKRLAVSLDNASQKVGKL